MDLKKIYVLYVESDQESGKFYPIGVYRFLENALEARKAYVFPILSYVKVYEVED